MKRKKKVQHLYGSVRFSWKRSSELVHKSFEKAIVHHRDENPATEEDLDEDEGQVCQEGAVWCSFPHLRQDVATLVPDS